MAVSEPNGTDEDIDYKDDMEELNGKLPSLLPSDESSYMTLFVCTDTNKYDEGWLDTYSVSLNFFSECKNLPSVSTAKQNVKLVCFIITRNLCKNEQKIRPISAFPRV